MGYNLTIGEAVIRSDPEYRQVDIEARGERHSNAPAFGDPTDYTNSRWPSYSTWYEFCKDVGLYDLFLDRDSDKCLIQHHPGAALLTEEVRQEINEALNKRRSEAVSAGRIASYCDKDDNDRWNIICPEPCPRHDGQLCRLEWLAYWVNWAVDNCEVPVLVNT